MTGEPVNIYEYEALAHERLPKPEYDFIAGGATDEITLKRTRAVFDAIMLRPRMPAELVDDRAGAPGRISHPVGSRGQSRQSPSGGRAGYS